jgi:hypothetical protein
MNSLRSVVFVIAISYCFTIGLLEVAISAGQQVPSFCSTQGYTTIGTWLIVDGLIMICYASAKFAKRYQELTCDSSCERAGAEDEVEPEARARARARAEEEEEEARCGDVPHVRSSPHLNRRLSRKSRAGGFPSNSSILTLFPYIDLLVEVAMLFKLAWAITGTVLLWDCVQHNDNDMVRTIFTLAVTQTYIICAIKLARLVL